MTFEEFRKTTSEREKMYFDLAMHAKTYGGKLSYEEKSDMAAEIIDRFNELIRQKGELAGVMELRKELTQLHKKYSNEIAKTTDLMEELQTRAWDDVICYALYDIDEIEWDEEL